MGYTDTTHYKMKKPDATNKFNVADLNNAMDTMDTTMFKVDTDLKATLANNDAENKRLISGIDKKVDDLADEIKNKGVLILNESIPNCNIKITNSATGFVYYDGVFTYKRIVTGLVTVNIIITTLNNTKTYQLQVVGEYTFNPSKDMIELEVDSKVKGKITKLTMSGVEIKEPNSIFKILPTTNCSIYIVTNMSWGGNNFISFHTQSRDYLESQIIDMTDCSSNEHVITTNGTFTFPVDAYYEVIMIGGGAGGSGGSSSAYYANGNIQGGMGGNGGNSGNIVRRQFYKSAGDKTSVVIGKGGPGGITDRITFDNSKLDTNQYVNGRPGGAGGATSFDGYSVDGGKVTPAKNVSVYSGKAGDGGDGGNGNNRETYYLNDRMPAARSYGGKGGVGKYPEADYVPGSKADNGFNFIYWIHESGSDTLALIGVGGKGGDSGSASKWGPGNANKDLGGGEPGLGAGGIMITKAGYGSGGDGGSGGWNAQDWPTEPPESRYAISNGTSGQPGTDGAIVIRVEKLK